MYYRDRLVIPEKYRNRVLDILHENHDGIVRSKMIARSSVWWPKIDQNIEEIVSKCFSCQTTQKVPREHVKTKWPLCEKPFQREHIDFFILLPKHYIYIDSFSKYIIVKYLPKTDAINLENSLLSIFRIFGYPIEIVTDNGPPFSSIHFEQFAQKLNIVLTKSPAYHPQSNGLAERGVQTIKNCLKKYLSDEKLKYLPIQVKLNKILMCYNNTPCTTTNKTPNNIIFSYQPTTLLSSLSKKIFKKNNNNNTLAYPKHSNEKFKTKILQEPIFKKGQKVLYRNHFKDYVNWIPATIHEVISPHTYKINVSNSVRFVQKNQIRHSTLEDKYHPLIPNEEYRTNTEIETIDQPQKRKKRYYNKVLHESIPLRRSKRKIVKPSNIQNK